MYGIVINPWFLQQGPPEQVPAAQFVLLVSDTSDDVVFADETGTVAVFVSDTEGD